MLRMLITFASLSFVLGCSSSASCPKGTARSEGRCIAADASVEDARTKRDAGNNDAGEADGATGCESQCGGQTPRCDPDTGLCVQCLVPSDCAAPTPACDSSTGLCVQCVQDDQCEGVCDMSMGLCVGCRSKDDCDAPTPQCEPTSRTCVECYEQQHCGLDYCDEVFLCVECLEQSHCTEPDAATCGPDGQCFPCLEDEDCAHIEGKPICVEAVCVECTPDKDAACGGNVCDPASFGCSTFAKGSARRCEQCIDSSQCAGDDVCAANILSHPMTVHFEMAGVYQEGLACLPPYRPSAPCTQLDPFARRYTTQTARGAEVEVCGLELSTCTLYRDYGKTCSERAQCGIPDVDAPLCNAKGRCASPCLEPSDCLSGDGCFGYCEVGL